MRVRTVRLADISDDDQHRWADLASRAVEPNAFCDPAFLVPAARWRPEAADMGLVVLEDGTEFLAVVVFTLARRLSGLTAPHLTTGGAFMSTTAPSHVPLVDRSRTHEALDALLAGITARSLRLPGIMWLSLLPGDGPLATALRDVAADRHVPVIERFRIDRAYVRPAPPARDGAGPTGHLSPRHQRKLARLTRGIERELAGPLQLEDRGDDPAAVDLFLDVEAAGWKGDPARGGQALRLDPARTRWFTEVTSAFRARRDLSILVLAAGGSTAYVDVTLRSGGASFGFLDTYDEKYSRFSAGAIGRVAVIDRFLRTSTDHFLDPCLHPRYADSTLLYPDRRPFVGLLLAPGGTGTRALVRSLPAAGRFRTRLRTARAARGRPGGGETTP